MITIEHVVRGLTEEEARLVRRTCHLFLRYQAAYSLLEKDYADLLGMLSKNQRVLCAVNDFARFDVRKASLHSMVLLFPKCDDQSRRLCGNIQ